MTMNPPIGPEAISVRFFRQQSGAEPVRDWLIILG